MKLVIYGEPIAKERPRATTINGYAHIYTTKKTRDYESKVYSAYLDLVKNTEYENCYMFDKDSLLQVSITAYFSLSKSDYGNKGTPNKSGRKKLSQVYCNIAKDTDNIAKIILDSLNKVCFYDDKQVVDLQVKKLWTTEQPKVEIEIIELLTGELNA